MKNRLASALVNGDRRLLAQTLSLVASKKLEDRQQIVALLQNIKRTIDSLRIAVTGAPGAGKSTLINQLGKHLLNNQPQHKIAVLAIDPTSPRSGGSVLGDRLRMSELITNDKVFVRSVASGESNASVHPYTAEMIEVCELAGYRTVIIETVGVGQNDSGGAQLADLVIAVVNPGSGDLVQGLKKGINELSDIFVINKDDGDNQQLVRRSYNSLQQSLTLSPHTAHCPILSVSAQDDVGIDKLVVAINRISNDRQRLVIKRRQQDRQLFIDRLQKLLGTQTFANQQELVVKVAKQMDSDNLSPAVAVQMVLRGGSCIN